MSVREQYLGKEIERLRDVVVRGEQRALTLGLRSNVKITIRAAEVLFSRGGYKLSDRGPPGKARRDCRLGRGQAGKIAAVDRIHVTRRAAVSRKSCYRRCR